MYIPGVAFVRSSLQLYLSNSIIDSTHVHSSAYITYIMHPGNDDRQFPYNHYAHTLHDKYTCIHAQRIVQSHHIFPLSQPIGWLQLDPRSGPCRNPARLITLSICFALRWLLALRIFWHDSEVAAIPVDFTCRGSDNV